MAAGEGARAQQSWLGCSRRTQNRAGFWTTSSVLPGLSFGMGALTGDLSGGAAAALALVMLEAAVCYVYPPTDDGLEQIRNRFCRRGHAAVVPAPEEVVVFDVPDAASFDSTASTHSHVTTADSGARPDLFPPLVPPVPPVEVAVAEFDLEAVV